MVETSAFASSSSSSELSILVSGDASDGTDQVSAVSSRTRSISAGGRGSRNRRTTRRSEATGFEPRGTRTVRAGSARASSETDGGRLLMMAASRSHHMPCG